MMGRLAEAVAADHQPKGSVCSVSTFLETLDDDDRAEMIGLLAEPMQKVSHATLVRAIEQVYDVQFGTTTIARHRRGQCRCGRSQ